MSPPPSTTIAQLAEATAALHRQRALVLVGLGGLGAMLMAAMLAFALAASVRVVPGVPLI